MRLSWKRVTLVSLLPHPALAWVNGLGQEWRSLLKRHVLDSFCGDSLVSCDQDCYHLEVRLPMGPGSSLPQPSADGPVVVTGLSPHSLTLSALLGPSSVLPIGCCGASPSFSAFRVLLPPAPVRSACPGGSGPFFPFLPFLPPPVAGGDQAPGDDDTTRTPVDFTKISCLSCDGRSERLAAEL